MSNARKKQFKVPKLSEPRSMEEINKSYSELVSKAGQCQYQLQVYQRELDQLNESLFSLNHEAAARNELNQKEAKKDVPNEG